MDQKEKWQPTPPDYQRYGIPAIPLLPVRMEKRLQIPHYRRKARAGKETEIFIPNDVLQEQTAEAPKTALRPFTDNIKRNIMAYPPDWVDTFGSNFYSHAQAQELAGFDKDSSWNISEQAVPYRDSELQVTSRTERDKNIEQIMSDMKEETND